jgi:hypothetical protein
MKRRPPRRYGECQTYDHPGSFKQGSFFTGLKHVDIFYDNIAGEEVMDGAKIYVYGQLLVDYVAQGRRIFGKIPVDGKRKRRDDRGDYQNDKDRVFPFKNGPL